MWVVRKPSKRGQEREEGNGVRRGRKGIDSLLLHDLNLFDLSGLLRRSTITKSVHEILEGRSPRLVVTSAGFSRSSSVLKRREKGKVSSFARSARERCEEGLGRGLPPYWQTYQIRRIQRHPWSCSRCSRRREGREREHRPPL